MLAILLAVFFSQFSYLPRFPDLCFFAKRALACRKTLLTVAL